eukprot:TRINITY_DN2983_c0_g1_i1.p1 TRINITY_DN2983_c0_g1~~TRINITY_DN2983_c0_g1_i1.p1  ORF type:complete len:1014 (+),score=541.19 TRINITY_DN2983_c0_g1_i1:179-3220(+)
MSEEKREFADLEAEVVQILKDAQNVHPDKVEAETFWFFRNLGLNRFYFQSTSAKEISSHVELLYAAKLLNQSKNGGQSELESLKLQQELPEKALYVVPSLPGQAGSPSELVEWRIESEYLKEGFKDLTVPQALVHEVANKRPLGLPFEVRDGGYRLQVYRTAGTVSPQSSIKLRMYFLQAPRYGEVAEKTDDVRALADVDFLKGASDHTIQLYQDILKDAQNSLGPVYHISDCLEGSEDGVQEIRLVVCYRYKSTHSLFSGITALYHHHGLHSTRKYIEPLSNGFIFYSFYLTHSPASVGNDSFPASLIERGSRLADDVSQIFVLPRTSLLPLFRSSKLTASEVSYAYALWKFGHQFLSSFTDEDMAQVSKSLDSASLGVLSKVRAGLKRDAMTEERVMDVIYNYDELIRLLYEDFAAVLDPKSPTKGARDAARDEKIVGLIRRRATSELDVRILLTFLAFNRHVLKTNFFKKSKVALSFRLDPAFVSLKDYPVKPFAIFFLIGAEFRGFHVRFSDIARGGIRIIRSANAAAFAVNVATVFDENYNLALTQQRKNKDIPEGGSKGTILLSPSHQEKAFVAFQKYTDALLDVLLTPQEDVLDFYGKQEILFLGPDEGTADFMDWASQHALHRQYPYWKSFTTGKSRSIGGIPHDYYGMTTRSIHQFVLGILRKLDLQESDIIKFQTGGPDGDLGSNEIKISNDRTIAVVDGSGVLYDPNGLDRAELVRLASNRLMSNNFDVAKLSAQGFFVGINDNDITLPNGQKIERGINFRNEFHLDQTLLNSVDLFVPCGGRPAAVNINNIQLLWNEATKSPRFKYVVEGANLFFTQEARLQLEKWGVIVFKDASANKGGVTSSSLEVLAALALNDAEFKEHMMVVDPANVPAFYTSYVENVQKIIEARAFEEFECIWKEHERTKTPRCVLTDQLSEKINRLHDSISQSSLWKNESLRKKVIAQSIPTCLIDLIGIDVLLERVPEAYLKAIFGANLASRFVYTHGLDAGEFGFFEFMTEFL